MVVTLGPVEGTMKRIVAVLLAGLVFAFLVPSPAEAQQPAHLVKDINPGVDREVGLHPTNLVAFDGFVYFAGYDEFHGSALWRTDGTPEGTRLWLDLEPGWNSVGYRLIATQDRLFIFRTSGEIWVSDGTPPGTRLLKTVPGLQTWKMASLGSAVFFTTFTPTSTGAHMALGRTDGTEAGTILVQEFDSTSWPLPSEFVAGDNLLYFNAPSGGRPALWRSDGTAAGTYPILQTDFRATQAATIGDALLFNHCDTTTSPQICELWRTEGTAASTRLLVDIGGAVQAFPYGLARVGPYVYFQAQDGTGYGLWRSDGSATGTIRLKARLSTMFLGEARPAFVAVGSLAVFGAWSEEGAAFWRSDGTPGGTVSIAPLPLEHASHVSLLSGAGPAYAMVTAYNADFSELLKSLWIIDGTATGTHHVASIDTGFSDEAVIAGHRVYFPSLTEESGFEVWAADAGGARMVVDVAPASSAWPSVLTAAGNSVLMLADANHAPDSPSYTEIWKSDGTADGTAMVKDLTPGINGEFFQLVPGANRVFFMRAGNELWTSDGTDAGTIKLADHTSGNLFPRTPVTTLYFGRRPGSVWEVWKTDGSPSGTVRVKTLQAYSESWNPPINFQAIGDVVYFHACTNEHGCEPWVTDGTEAGTRLVADVMPGAGSSNPWSFTAANGQVFFSAFINPHQLWKTDGTAAGTTLVHSFEGSTVVYSLTALDTGLIFAARVNEGQPGAANQLWFTDGTPAGTAPIFSLSPGESGNVNIWGFRRIGDIVLFAANDGVHGRELWRTDGTAAGTTMIVDLFPGERDGVDFNTFAIVVSGLRAVFTGISPEHGSEVFVTDGTATRLLTDINPGSEPSNAYEIAVAGSNLFIAAGRPDVGYELWTVVVSPAGAIDDLAQELDALGVHAGFEQSLKAKLQAALRALERDQIAMAASLLQAFINEVQAQSGKKITEADAAALIEHARRIIESLE
jgi:ELWxxDGT repeat protein